MLDFKTLIVLNFVVNVINFMTMAALWRRHGTRYRGLTLWTAAMAMHAVGAGLILGRGLLPEFATAVVANVLLMTTTLVMLIGLERFSATPGRHGHNVAACVAHALALYYFSAVDPSYVARLLASSALIVFIDLQTCWLTFHRAPPRMRRIMFGIGLVTAGYVVAALARIILLLGLSQESELVRSGLANSAAVTAFIALHVLMIVALATALSRRLQDEVQAQEEKFSKAFHAAPYALIVSRKRDGRVIEVNTGFTRIFGNARAETLERPLADLLVPADEEVGRVTDGQDESAAMVRLRRQNGETMIGRLSADAVEIDGEPCVLTSIDDVTEEHRLRQRLVELASRDDLTGLANRRSFYERFAALGPHALRRGERMAVLSLDLDRFKPVNDTLGHAAGDLLLQQVAQRMTACLRAEDLVARFGGDEFVVLLVEARSINAAVHVADKIVAALAKPFRLGEHDVVIGTSIGIALFPDHGDGLEALLRASDAALYAAKAAGRNGCKVAGHGE